MGSLDLLEAGLSLDTRGTCSLVTLELNRYCSVT